MTYWKTAALGLVTLGVTSAGAVVLAGGGRGGPEAVAQLPAAKGETTPAAKPAPAPKPDEAAEQAKRFLDAARRRLDAQRKFYEEGRITIDRYIEALRLVRDAEMTQATTRAEREAVAKALVDRIGEVLRREKAELEAGRSTFADVSEAELAVEGAAAELLNVRRSPGAADLEALQTRVERLEGQLDRVLKHLERTGIDLPDGSGAPPRRRR